MRSRRIPSETVMLAYVFLLAVFALGVLSGWLLRLWVW